MTSRIDVLVPTFDGGGAERAAITVATALHDRGHLTRLIVGRADGPLRAGVPDRLAVVELGAGSMVRGIPRLREVIRAQPPAGVVAVMHHAGFAAAAARIANHPFRLLVWEQNHLSVNLASLPAWRRSVAARQVRWAYRQADVVAGVSDGVAADVRTQLAGIEPVVLHNPVVTDELLSAAQREPESELFRHGLGGHRFVVGVGRLSEQKDFTTLLEAFAIGAPPDMHIVILGDGPLREALAGRGEELGLSGRLHLPGFVADVPAWLRASDLFVLSSRWEGLPTVVIEALAAGTRVVSTRCPSGPEEILEDGTLGELVPVGDHRALADAMARALDRPRVDVTDRLRDRYGPETVTRQLERLLGVG